MTARDVRMTRQPNGVMMKHSTRKSTLFELIMFPDKAKHHRTAYRRVAPTFTGAWWPFCSKHGHVMRTSCDLLPAKS